VFEHERKDKGRMKENFVLRERRKDDRREGNARLKAEKLDSMDAIGYHRPRCRMDPWIG